MTSYWPEDLRLQIPHASLDAAENTVRIRITFIGPDGQPHGEPLEITAKENKNEAARQK